MVAKCVHLSVRELFKSSQKGVKKFGSKVDNVGSGWASLNSLVPYLVSWPTVRSRENTKARWFKIPDGVHRTYPVRQAANDSSPAPMFSGAICVGHVSRTMVGRATEHVRCATGQSGAHLKRKASN